LCNSYCLFFSPAFQAAGCTCFLSAGCATLTCGYENLAFQAVLCVIVRKSLTCGYLAFQAVICVIVRKSLTCGYENPAFQAVISVIVRKSLTCGYENPAFQAVISVIYCFTNHLIVLLIMYFSLLSHLFN
jgi:hypothetical protein